MDSDRRFLLLIGNSNIGTPLSHFQLSNPDFKILIFFVSSFQVSLCLTHAHIYTLYYTHTHTYICVCECVYMSSSWTVCPRFFPYFLSTALVIQLIPATFWFRCYILPEVIFPAFYISGIPPQGVCAPSIVVSSCIVSCPFPFLVNVNNFFLTSYSG